MPEPLVVFDCVVFLQGLIKQTGPAQFLVTRDRDLLDLMRWDTEEGRDFQSRFRELRILDPVTFIKELGSH